MENYLWRIGGPQGSGIDRAALLFSRVCAKRGLHVLARREYHSNIMGRHSYSDVRFGVQAVLSHSASPQMLVCLDAESVCRHIHNVPHNGCILYDSRIVDTQLSQLKLLDAQLLEKICKPLQAHDLTCNVHELLKMSEQHGCMPIAVDFEMLFHQLRDDLGIPKSGAERSRNVLAVAISAALLGLTSDNVCRQVAAIFQNKPDAITLNARAIQLAYEYTESLAAEVEKPVMPVEAASEECMWINGTQSVALGKLAAGLGLQSYYPISPATDESIFLESNNVIPLSDTTQAGPVVLQTEDELAAISVACGAAQTGARAATSTSGPGFSLMVEGLGWAGMTETPVVVTLYQRGGPATGLPTRTEQGDLQFAIHAGHGEFPRIVIASGDVEECFYDAFRAFNYAERYQLPVIHLLDKNLASTAQTLPTFATDDLLIDRGELLQTADGSLHASRFQFSNTGISPRPLLGDSSQIFLTTGVEHDETGHVSENPEIRMLMEEKRAKKLILAAKEIPLNEKLCTYGDAQAETMLISWGSNKGVVFEAVDHMTQEDRPMQAVMVKLLWPFPVAELKVYMENVKKVIVLECNQSAQFSQLFRQEVGHHVDYHILKYNGRPFVVEELLQSLISIFDGTAKKLVIHNNVFE